MIERHDDQKFDLVSAYQPAGDQPQAIDKLVQGFQRGEKNRSCWGRPGLGRRSP